MDNQPDFVPKPEQPAESGFLPPNPQPEAFSYTPPTSSAPPESAYPPPAFETPPSPIEEPVAPPSGFNFLLKNKKLLIILPLFLIGFLAAFSFFKKLGSFTKSVSKGPVVYWGLWEEEATLKPIIDEFQKTHPKIKISYIKQSPTQYRERLQNALSRGKGPDIFRFHNTWLPMLKNDLAPVPGTVFDNNSFEKTFYSTSQKDLKIGTSYYGIPLYIDTLALYINEDSFDKIGLSPPTTWEDLRKDASLLTEKEEDGRIKVAGVAIGTAGNVDHWSDILGLMMLQNGIDFKKVDKTITPDGKNRGENTLSYYTQYVLLDHVWDETLPSSTSMFAAGKLAMYFAPSWRIFEIKAYNPNLKFKIVPVPQLPGVNVNWATYWVEGVAKKSVNQAAAWEFLKFLITKETLVKLYNESSKVRLFGEPYGRSDMADLLAADPLVFPFLQQVKTAKSWYLCSSTFDNGANDRMIKYFEDAVNSVLKGGAITEALTTAALGVNQLSSLYQLP